MGIAQRQYGVISLEQLLACGLSYKQVERLVEKGHLHRLHRGVYAVGHRRLISHAHLIAALLAAGPRSFLSHRTAAAVWGLRQLAVRAIEVTSPTGRGRTGLTIHRASTDPHPDDLCTRNGLRISSFPRLLVELAPRESAAELDRLITEAVRRGILRPDKVEEALERHARRPGSARLRHALAAYRPKPDRTSELERAFDALLARHPDIPPPLANVRIGIWEIDCYWPEQRVALELDGRPYHVAIADLEKDRYKDAKLLGMGIRPLRITDRRLESDPLGALGDLRVLLATAA